MITIILFITFISVAIAYYSIQKDKIRREEKRRIFKEKQEQILKQLCENARKEDAKKAEKNFEH